MPRDMAASILMLMQRLRDGTHPQPPEALVIAMEAFDRMEIAGARSVLQLWRLDRQYRTAIDEVAAGANRWPPRRRSEEHTSELKSLIRISYTVFCLNKKQSLILSEHIYTQ